MITEKSTDPCFLCVKAETIDVGTIIENVVPTAKENEPETPKEVKSVAVEAKKVENLKKETSGAEIKTEKKLENLQEKK